MQNFKGDVKNGVVHTDFSLINKMLSIFPKEVFKDPNLKWLDPCCGRGYFMIALLKRLMSSLDPPNNTREYIIKNMLYMVEIDQDYVAACREIFGEGANILHKDFFEMENDFPSPDIIIGNPPFNRGGLKKVPTKAGVSKKFDGRTVWPSFVKTAIGFLKDGGLFNMIIPSIWMKQDKAGMYDFLLQYNITKIHCFNNTETNRMFHGHAQTPTSFFLLEKIATRDRILLYDSQMKVYIPWKTDGGPIPVFASAILLKLRPWVKKYGSLNVFKTSMPPVGIFFGKSKSNILQYPNIKTCRLNGRHPELIINYSNKPILFHGIPKLVLAHKMYGFPYLDLAGRFGISNRDNYVFFNRSLANLRLLHDFLSTRFVRYLFEGCRYRMKFLEKYIFELIPDLTQFYVGRERITDRVLCRLFFLSEQEKAAVLNYHKKEYSFCREKIESPALKKFMRTNEKIFHRANS
tara:strand:- start:871 stop:2256 length:1386 start_codon:yes stop_codon:yes gene_type:complete